MDGKANGGFEKKGGERWQEESLCRVGLMKINEDYYSNQYIT